MAANNCLFFHTFENQREFILQDNAYKMKSIKLTRIIKPCA